MWVECFTSSNSRSVISYLSEIAKYLLHGFVLLVFSSAVLYLYLSYNGYSMTLRFIVVFIYISGTEIAGGLINMILADVLWSVDGRFTTNNIFYQGVKVALPSQIFLAMLVIILPYQGPFIFMVSTVLYCIIIGILGVYVARKHSTKNTKTELKRTIPISIGTRGRCPTCGESFRYTSRDILDDGMVRCLSCHKPFFIESKEELMKKIGKFEADDSDTSM